MAPAAKPLSLHSGPMMVKDEHGGGRISELGGSNMPEEAHKFDGPCSTLDSLTTIGGDLLCSIDEANAGGNRRSNEGKELARQGALPMEALMVIEESIIATKEEGRTKDDGPFASILPSDLATAGHVLGQFAHLLPSALSSQWLAKAPGGEQLPEGLASELRLARHLSSSSRPPDSSPGADPKGLSNQVFVALRQALIAIDHAIGPSAAEEDSGPAITQVQAAVNHRRPHVLIVAGDAEVALDAVTRATAAGFSVHVARNPVSALADVAEGGGRRRGGEEQPPFDAVITEVDFGFMGGLEAVRRMRGIPGGARMTIVVVRGEIGGQGGDSGQPQQQQQQSRFSSTSSHAFHQTATQAGANFFVNSYVDINFVDLKNIIQARAAGISIVSRVDSETPASKDGITTGGGSGSHSSSSSSYPQQPQRQPQQQQQPRPSPLSSSSPPSHMKSAAEVAAILTAAGPPSARTTPPCLHHHHPQQHHPPSQPTSRQTSPRISELAPPSMTFTPTSIPSTSNITVAAPVVKSENKLRRACAHCHAKKIACSCDRPCDRCRDLSQSCVEYQPKDRGDSRKRPASALSTSSSSSSPIPQLQQLSPTPFMLQQLQPQQHLPLQQFFNLNPTQQQQQQQQYCPPLPQHQHVIQHSQQHYLQQQQIQQHQEQQQQQIQQQRSSPQAVTYMIIEGGGQQQQQQQHQTLLVLAPQQQQQIEQQQQQQLQQHLSPQAITYMIIDGGGQQQQRNQQHQLQQQQQEALLISQVQQQRQQQIQQQEQRAAIGGGGMTYWTGPTATARSPVWMVPHHAWPSASSSPLPSPAPQLVPILVTPSQPSLSRVGSASNLVSLSGPPLPRVGSANNLSPSVPPLPSLGSSNSISSMSSTGSVVASIPPPPPRRSSSLVPHAVYEQQQQPQQQQQQRCHHHPLQQQQQQHYAVVQQQQQALRQQHKQQQVHRSS